MDIAGWLRSLGLERYEKAFRVNDIDAGLLPDLTADDLTSLGVTLVGHRRTLLAAIAALRVSTPSAADPGPSSEAHLPSAVAVARSGGAERRQLTVMFCDLVGSTALSTRLDLDDLSDVIVAYKNCVAEVVARFDGFVARYLGDGALVYFGYPHAHEDDSERAVRCALTVVDRVTRLELAEELQIRLGIATGMVVVGDVIGSRGRHDHEAVGEPPNLAACLQALAQPNTVLIDENTRRLVGKLFDYCELGAVAARGFSQPVAAWQVLRPSIVASRFEALRASSLTPLVGRGEEIEVLLRHWRRASKGEGQAILLSGEPGIGKSRLTVALRERLQTEPHFRLSFFCSPHHHDSALFPFVSYLERAAAFDREDGLEARADKLEALLSSTAIHEGDLGLLAELLSLSGAGRYPRLDLSPQRKKEETFEAVYRHLAALAKQKPVLMIFEDLQWIDPTSRELLDRVIERIERSAVLLMATFRPEFQPPWAEQRHVTMLALSRLGRGEGAILVQRLAGDGATLPSGVVDEIVTRADGVPLFIEELTRAVLEATASERRVNGAVAAASMAAINVPATLSGSLLARLDRLGPAKDLAQIGAAIGREFSYELLAAVAGRDKADIQSGLDRLTEAGLVFRRGVASDGTFVFKHALVQDAAYSTLLRGKRQELHARIAGAIEKSFSELSANQPEILARHLTEAGMSECAVRYWLDAGRTAIAQAAPAEALAHLAKGIDLLNGLPDTPERRHRELDFQVALGTTLIGYKGIGVPEVGRAFARALDLLGDFGDSPHLIAVYYGNWYFHYGRQTHIARGIGERLLELGRRRQDDCAILVGHRIVGQSYGILGELDRSERHLVAALDLYDEKRHRSLELSYVYDARLGCLNYLSMVKAVQGYYEKALSAAIASLAESRALLEMGARTPTMASALYNPCIFRFLCRDWPALVKRAEALEQFADENRFAGWLATSAFH
jgi:class 3 adenylate cyclase